MTTFVLAAGALGAVNLSVSSSSATPTLIFNFIPMPLAGDILNIFDNSISVGTYALTPTDILNSSFTMGLSALSTGTHNIYVNVERASVVGPNSNTVTIIV